MGDIASVVFSRPVVVPGVLFALAFGLHYNDYPTLAAVLLGAGGGLDKFWSFDFFCFLEHTSH